MRTIATWLFLLAALPAAAQQRVTGTVTSSEDGEPLVGVNVIVKGTLRGTTTDLDGIYRIDLRAGETVLVFSYAGHERVEVDAAGRTTVDVTLEMVSTLLGEAVVIGYGTVLKRDLTGAVGSIRSEDILKVTALNAEQSLQGRISGVHITTVSGAPGAGAAVRIRGVGTFNNASPIYVVDGVILDDISFLSPADIASMEILKDASATAIFGSRGANGVVLVQTKSGARGSTDPEVNVTMEAGLQRLEKTIDLLSGRQFAIISNEIRPGSYNNVDAVPNTDWQSLVFDVAPMSNLQVSVSAAGLNSDYYLSVGHFQQQGIIDRSWYERLTLKLNNTYRLSGFFKLGNNVTVAPYSQRIVPDVTFSVYRAQPVLEPYYADGSFGVVYNVGNPLADIANSNNYRDGVRVVGNVFAEATMGRHSTFRSSFGVDASVNRGRSFTPAFVVNNPDGTASQQFNEFSDISKGNGIRQNWLWENTVTHLRTTARHHVNATVGFTMQQTRSEDLRLAGQNVLRDDPDFWYVEPTYVVDESNNINMLFSLFNGVDPGAYYNMVSALLRVSYTFDEKYLTTVTVRRDGSSKFAQENRWGTFPSFALGWNIGQESFLDGLDWLSAAKIRFSWGQIGNEKIAYFDRFARVQSNLAGVFGNPDDIYPGATYGKSGNPDLKWETTTQTDIGLEWDLFKGKLTGEMDWFNRVTDDILVELSTPGHLGNGQGVRVRYNAASVENRGLEFNLKWQERRGDVGYAIGLVTTHMRNEVLAIGGNSGIDSTLIGGFLGNGQPVTLSRIGRPIGAFYGYKTDGVFQNQSELDSHPRMAQAGIGDLRFVDVNGDGVINGNDRTYLGSPIPTFIFGLNADLDWKGFDLSLSFQGQTGNQIFNGKNVVRPDPYNFEAHVFDRWRGEGTSNSEPRASFGGYNFLPSDRFIHDGSFVRLRSVTFGYTLDPRISSRVGLSRARVYAQGTNLLTWTRYTGYTPEIGSFDVLSTGIDNGIYPIPAIYSIGLQATIR
jgi:TonB-linked SusC/RagA family outer membrane protein